MALRITINITDEQEKCLKYDLADIEKWVVGAVNGKINNCKGRMIDEWRPKLFADPAVDQIPADDAAFVNFVTARADYKDRAAREQE